MPEDQTFSFVSEICKSAHIHCHTDMWFQFRGKCVFSFIFSCVLHLFILIFCIDRGSITYLSQMFLGKLILTVFNTIMTKSQTIFLTVAHIYRITMISANETEYWH